MIQSDTGSGRRNAESVTLSQPKEVSAGRQNLLSAIWGITRKVGTQTMPNGDPPSLMLWGVEEDSGVRRLAGRQKRMYS